MRNIVPSAIQLPQTDLDEIFHRWCHDQGIQNPRGKYFSMFSRLLRQQIQTTFPSTLMQTSTFSFGGADGGGGVILADAQGEDVDEIREKVGPVSSVSPFSLAQYFRALHSRIIGRCPEAVVCEEPTDNGVALFVEERAWDNVVNRVQRKEYLSRNITDIRHFDLRRWNMAQERLHARVDLWSVLNAGSWTEQKPVELLASEEVAA